MSILREHPLPEEVDKGIKMPNKVLDGRNKIQRRFKQDREDWLAFLRNLDIGDSFVVPNHRIQYVKLRFKDLDYDWVLKREDNHPDMKYATRFWLYGRPGHRNKVWRKTKTVQVEEVVVDG